MSRGTITDQRLVPTGLGCALDARRSDVGLDRELRVVAPLSPRTVVDPDAGIARDAQRQGCVSSPNAALAVGHKLLLGLHSHRCRSGANLGGIAQGAVGPEILLPRPQDR